MPDPFTLHQADQARTDFAIVEDELEARRRIYLWRAVDHESEILDMLVQRRRDKHAALRLLKKQGLAPKLLETDNSAPLILAHSN